MKGDGLIVLYDVTVRDEEGETILFAAGIHGASAAHNLIATFFARRREPGRTPGHSCVVDSRRVPWQTLYPPDPRRGKNVAEEG